MKRFSNMQAKFLSYQAVERWFLMQDGKPVTHLINVDAYLLAKIICSKGLQCDVTVPMRWPLRFLLLYIITALQGDCRIAFTYVQNMAWRQASPIALCKCLLSDACYIVGEYLYIRWCRRQVNALYFPRVYCPSLLLGYPIFINVMITITCYLAWSSGFKIIFCLYNI